MIVIPGFADIVQYDSPTTATNQASAVVSSNAPKYAFDEITSSDQGHIASTAYVKGAYNSALSAINYLSDDLDTKVDTVTDAVNTYAHPVVTSLTKSGDTITVTKGEVTIPVGSASTPSSHATIWIE